MIYFGYDSGDSFTVGQTTKEQVFEFGKKIDRDWHFLSSKQKVQEALLNVSRKWTNADAATRRTIIVSLAYTTSQHNGWDIDNQVLLFVPEGNGFLKMIHFEYTGQTGEDIFDEWCSLIEE